MPGPNTFCARGTLGYVRYPHTNSIPGRIPRRCSPAKVVPGCVLRDGYPGGETKRSAYNEKMTAMKWYIAFLLGFSLLNGILPAQNLPPVVQITSVQVDEPAQTVTVHYDLSDPEGDACTVRFGISLDGGETFLAQNGQWSGDLGSDQAPGPQKSITWVWDNIPDIHQTVVRVSAEDGHVPDIQAMVDQVDSLRLIQWLQTLAVPRHHSAHTGNLQVVRDTIYATLEALPFQTTMQPVFYQGSNFPNILSRQSGLEDEAATIIVDGHYDGVTGSPGADDNASSVAAMLEIARVLAPYQFRKSIRYIGFAFEEQGLIGSQAYVQSGIKPWEQVEGVLNMEMIGYYSDEPNSQELPFGFGTLFPEAVQTINANENRGDFITIVGNQSSQPLIDIYEQACDMYVPGLKYIPLTVPGNGQIAPDLRRSDHARFWDAGYQALMLTDGANFRNKNYHTPGDSIATLDIGFMTRVTRATLAAAALLAQPVQAGMDVFSLSDLVGVHHHRAFPCSVGVYPNPARDRLEVRIGQCAGESITVRLMSLDGREWLMTTLRPDRDVQVFSFPLSPLPAGVYMLVLDDGHSSHSERVTLEP